MKVHVETVHRSSEFVYYEIKYKLYGPGIKNDIKEILNKCEVCLKYIKKRIRQLHSLQAADPSKKWVSI